MARYARADDLLWRTTASAVIIRRVDGRGATLQGTGTLIWERLAHPGTLEELVDRLRADFADPQGTLAGDVADALGHLLHDGVLVEVDGS